MPLVSGILGLLSQALEALPALKCLSLKRSGRFPHGWGVPEAQGAQGFPAPGMPLVKGIQGHPCFEMPLVTGIRGTSPVAMPEDYSHSPSL